MEIVEIARLALDHCEAGDPDPGARRVMADLLCEAPWLRHQLTGEASELGDAEERDPGRAAGSGAP